MSFRAFCILSTSWKFISVEVICWSLIFNLIREVGVHGGVVLTHSLPDSEIRV